MDTQQLLKYIEGNATEQEKVVIVNWLDADPENLREFLALRKLQDIAIWHTAPQAEATQEHPNRLSIWRVKNIYLEAIKIAAVLLVAILVSRYVLPDFKPANPVVMQTLHVPAGQRAQITLADGTKVWLNAKTTLTFPNQFSDQFREVRLDGEGFFEVSANKLKPFIVKTEKYDVKVWGTKFNLMAYSRKEIFETSLLEGSVEVLNSGGSNGVMLKPYEQISQKDNLLVRSSITQMNHFLWKEGIISFNDENFLEMVSKLELYFDLKINCSNDKILSYRCTGKFRTKDGVEHILKVLQLSNKFSFKVDDKQNTITIE